MNTATADAVRCRICTCKLDAEEPGDDFDHRVCSACLSRPEARRLGIGLAPLHPTRPHVAAAAAAPGKPAREFTPAELSLITKVHGFMPAQQLLDILNERLRCDLGEDAQPYTLAQLQVVVSRFAPAAPAGGHDWASLRKVLAQARRAGVVAKITEQLINDFAVVFGLNARQVMALKDVLLEGEGADE